MYYNPLKLWGFFMSSYSVKESLVCFLSIFTFLVLSGCVSEGIDDDIQYRQEKDTQNEGIKRINMEGASNTTINSKYPKKYSNAVSYSVDRSYINSVDYPMSMEAYYASRFTNKKDDVTKPPFTVSPIGSKIKEVYIDTVVERINSAKDLSDIKDELLMIRKKYIDILSISKHCCSYGLMTKFENIGVDNDYIFKFMIDDKRLYELQNICMIINNNDIANLLGSVELSVVVRDVRDSCVCKNREVLARHLELFKAIVGKTDLFKKHNILFRYKNELGEIVKNSIGRDMINLLNTLEQCP